jgi:phosphatidylserine/phosphatidylglycerophosphate/cardiolipin synthase-like enzyme
MLVGLISLKLFTTQVLAAETEIGFSPEGSALQLVLNTINSSTESIRLMGYSFTSPEVAGALVRAKQRDVDVKVVLDGKKIPASNTRRARRP